MSELNSIIDKEFIPVRKREDGRFYYIFDNRNVEVVFQHEQTEFDGILESYRDEDEIYFALPFELKDKNTILAHLLYKSVRLVNLYNREIVIEENLKIGNRIKAQREINHLSQEELADLIGVSSSVVISNWETGKTYPDINNIKQLCAVLKCSADYLIMTNKDCPNEANTPGKRLKLLIEKTGMKQKAFSEASGVVPNTLSKFVNDKKPMSDKYIRKAAAILESSYDYIKFGIDFTDADTFLCAPTKDILIKSIDDRLQHIEDMLFSIMEYMHMDTE